jgi:hypothetical protein
MRVNLVATAAAIAVLIAVLHAGPPGAHAAGSTMYGSGAAAEHLLREMDTDKNGTVSRHEFAQFVSRTFEGLDTNHNGRLERNELRPLAGSRWSRTRARPR